MDVVLSALSTDKRVNLTRPVLFERFSDGTFCQTDIADTAQLFRLIQSIPSPKAEPFKLWLAQVASERLDEMEIAGQMIGL